MRKYLLLILFAWCTSCVSTEELRINSDQEILALDQLIHSLPQIKELSKLEKSVTFDQQTESETFLSDSTTVSKDLRFILDASFPSLVQTAGYRKIIIEKGWLFERKANETKGPVKLVLEKNSEGGFNAVHIYYHSANYLYESDQKISLFFDKGALREYRIEGRRQLIGMEPSNYSITTKIFKP